MKIAIYDNSWAVQLDRKNIIEMKQCRALEAIYPLLAEFFPHLSKNRKRQLNSPGAMICVTIYSSGFYFFIIRNWMAVCSPGSSEAVVFPRIGYAHNMKLRFAIFHA